ncbi:MAG: PLP-dependent transferase, partial [Thermodesulfobacteriota bacterium]|nr:PLP-dependent transferase [Thermodesulfobacteriota bacterium]
WILVTESALLPLIQKEHFLNTQHSFCHSPQLSWGFSSVINYPGIESHPGHQRACELFDGFSGMLSFELKGGVEAAERFMQNTALPIVAPSLGGIESLITRPVTTSHSGLCQEDLKKLGISDNLIRFSVGIEATEDLIEDFKQALD